MHDASRDEIDFSFDAFILLPFFLPTAYRLLPTSFTTNVTTAKIANTDATANAAEELKSL